MKNPMNTSSYFPSDFQRLQTVAQHQHDLCDTGLQHWVRIHAEGATLVVRGVSRIEGQVKTITVEL